MKLIAFCGMDGSGKSTQSELLEKYLQRQNIPVKRIHFFSKGGTASSKVEDDSLIRPILIFMRKLPTAGLGGLLKAMVGVVSFTVDAWVTYYQLRRDYPGKVIVADRYFYDHITTFASRYLGGLGWFLRITRLMPLPDLVFVFEVSPEISFQRKGEYSIELLTTFRENYLRLAGLLKCKTYDGTDPIDTIDQDIIQQVRKIYG